MTGLVTARKFPPPGSRRG